MPPEMPKSFVEKEEARTATHDVDAITHQMVSAALQADVGGGQKAAIYGSYHDYILRPARLLLLSEQQSRLPEDIKRDLQAQGNKRIRNNLASASGSFRSHLETMALILYVEATNPNADIDRLLRMEKQAIENTVEAWGHYVDMDKVFPNDRDYPGSPQRLPNMLKAVEAAMRQSLKDQKISKDIQVTPY